MSAELAQHGHFKPMLKLRKMEAGQFDKGMKVIEN